MRVAQGRGKGQWTRGKTKKEGRCRDGERRARERRQYEEERKRGKKIPRRQKKTAAETPMVQSAVDNDQC